MLPYHSSAYFFARYAMVSLLATMFLPLTGAQAHIAKSLSLVQLKQQAHLIVEGTVIQQKSYWEKQIIYTTSQVKVQSCWKGSCEQKTITVRQLGGSVNNIGMRVYGVVHLKVKSKVLLFLNSTTNNTKAKLYQIIGLSQGLLRFVQHKQQKWLIQDSSEMLLLSSKKGQKQLQHGQRRLLIPQRVQQLLRAQP